MRPEIQTPLKPMRLLILTIIGLGIFFLSFPPYRLLASLYPTLLPLLVVMFPYPDPTRLHLLKNEIDDNHD